MPRPNKPRDVLAERNLARRIASERDVRGWTNEGLAKRMTDAGCAMTGSAIFKIEKGSPPRRIVVDELVAFAKVFGVTVEELLLPPEVAVQRELARLVVEWNYADDAARAATEKRDEAWASLQTYVDEHPDSGPLLEEVFRTWAETYFAEEHRDGATAFKMWQLTHDAKWADIVKADIAHG